ncbi:hypothetical protein L345_05594, partial [Ophiophagus hannah]
MYAEGPENRPEEIGLPHLPDLVMCHKRKGPPPSFPSFPHESFRLPIELLMLFFHPTRRRKGRRKEGKKEGRKEGRKET